MGGEGRWVWSGWAVMSEVGRGWSVVSGVRRGWMVGWVGWGGGER
jgi:hypothetical protein